MEIFRQYENQLRRVQNALLKQNNANTEFTNARNNFIKKYLAPNNQSRKNEKFIYITLPKHPNLKPYVRKLENAARVRMLEVQKLKNLENKVRRVFHMPYRGANFGNANGLSIWIRQERERRGRALAKLHLNQFLNRGAIQKYL